MRTALVAGILAAVVVSACGSPASTGPTEPPFVIPSDEGTPAESGSPGGSPGSTAGLPGWSFINEDGASVSADADGTITVALKNRLLWFRASKGFLMYRPADGDFRVTAHVVATSSTDPGQPPGGDGSVQLGGLMVRDPKSPPENWVHIVVGDDGDGLSVETKTTKDSVSTWSGPAWTDNEADLRICRVGAKVTLYKRLSSDDPWSRAITYERPDLPAKLDAGIDAYTNDQPDITITVFDFTIAPVKTEADCTTD